MEKNKKRKARGHEVLLADDASSAQEWIVENDEVANDVDLAKGADEELGPRTSARLRERELYEDNFESESEDDVDEEVEYESDGNQKLLIAKLVTDALVVFDSVAFGISMT
ncbi:hypothetical protein CTI12_AA184470 [Artemisia annua]|uniref:Uncharacterized protein n=1 Tax=Artemisia annua TaxID=35608 RepID=A0A2U1P7K9_ARTAN|nr:hypothetical protein CTI12_AA184470 [Artemisia annua]